MSQPNPFMPPQPAQPEPQQQQYAPAPQQQPNPFTAPQPQQQYAPAPAPNPYAQPAPQYAPAPQQQYTQQPQQYPVQQQAAAPGPIPVAQPGGYLAPPAPSASGSSNMPRMQDLQSRLLIVMPEKVERQVPSNKPQYPAQDRMTCTIVVLDGGPLQWGGLTPNSQRMNEQVPYVIKGIWIRQTKLVEQLEEALALRLQGGPGLLLGRLWKTGAGQNDPYVFATPSPQDGAMYDQYVTHVNPFTL